MFRLTRSENNPLLSPIKEHPWEANGSFNASPVVHGKKQYLIYRAQSLPDPLRNHIQISSIGKAVSTNGIDYKERGIFIAPSEDHDRFGCEDPRVTFFEGTHFIFYTGLRGFPFGPDNIRISVALSKDLEKVDEKHAVTTFDSKAMALFPERINGKIAALLSPHTDLPPSEICYAEFDRKEDIWSEEYWKNWYQDGKGVKEHSLQNIRRVDSDHLELGAVPLKTEKGWVVIYSHIQKKDNHPVTFGIEVVLLDLNNPRKVIGRTKGPVMVPEAYYEMVGMVPRVIFPSGARIVEEGKGKTKREALEIHYSAADTHCATATIPLEDLLETMIDNIKVSTDRENRLAPHRHDKNPIISPRPGVAFESMGTCNPAAIDLDGQVHLLYRAVAEGNHSTVGYAISENGLDITERLDAPIYGPRADFESYGVEDSRVVEIDGRIYMTYTGYNGSRPRVTISSISTEDFLKRDWTKWSKPEPLSPDTVDDKDSALFPEVIDGKYAILHRLDGCVCLDYLDSLDFTKERIDSCIEILGPRQGMWDGEKIGIAGPPIKTKKGWLLFYHGISWNMTYRMGAALLDLNDPSIVIARTSSPVLEPREEYEKKGIVSNVVFPCGTVIRHGTIYIYYGAADFHIGVATLKLAGILKILTE